MSEPIKKHVPTSFDKQLLVWYKKYPSKDQIPSGVNETMMKRVHNKARIHGSLLITGLALIGMFCQVLNAKRAVKRGESVIKMNQDFHNEYNQRFK